MTTRQNHLELSWWVWLAGFIALLIYSTGCAARPVPVTVRMQAMQLAATEQATLIEAPVSEMRIDGLLFIEEPPAQHLVGYELSTGTAIWKVTSNFCRQVRITYSSPVQCAVFYNWEPRGQWTNYSTGGYSFTSGWLRISGQLAAGAHEVTLPMGYGDTGYFMIRPFGQ